MRQSGVFRRQLPGLRELWHPDSRVRQHHGHMVGLVGMCRSGRVRAERDAELRCRGDAIMRRRLQVEHVHQSGLCRRRHAGLRKLRDADAHVRQDDGYVVGLVGVHGAGRLRSKFFAELRQQRNANVWRQLQVGGDVRRPEMHRACQSVVRQLRNADAHLRQ